MYSPRIWHSSARLVVPIAAIETIGLLSRQMKFSPNTRNIAANANEINAPKTQLFRLFQQVFNSCQVLTQPKIHPHLVPTKGLYSFLLPRNNVPVRFSFSSHRMEYALPPNVFVGVITKWSTCAKLQPCFWSELFWISGSSNLWLVNQSHGARFIFEQSDWTPFTFSANRLCDVQNWDWWCNKYACLFD